MATTYTFSVRDVGVLTSGLTPSITTLMGFGGVAIAFPVIAEISNGFYKFDIDWTHSNYDNLDEIVFVIDAGAVIAAADERWITGKLNRSDTVSISDVFEAIAGTWTILNNQMIMKDASGVTIRTFNLLDSNGDPTSTQVITRQYVS